MEETREMLQNPVTVVFYRKAYRRTEAREPQDVSGQRTPKLCVPDRMNDSEGCRRVWCPSDGVKQRVLFFFHRRAAPARFAAIPTWRRRWAVGALGARPDAYTLRRTEAALVPYNGLCHSYKRQGSVINACAQQGTVLQRHAPPQFLPIETISLRTSRNGFM